VVASGWEEESEIWREVSWERATDRVSSSFYIES
jgi:hypothetical protein